MVIGDISDGFYVLRRMLGLQDLHTVLRCSLLTWSSVLLHWGASSFPVICEHGPCAHQMSRDVGSVTLASFWACRALFVDVNQGKPY
jgi:hypothetical protein